jgi:hypothetical protein
VKLESIAEKLQTAGVGQQGQTIFINHMPSETLGVLLRTPFSGSQLDHELPGFRKTSFQMVVRDASHGAAMTKMTAAVAALATELETDFPQGMKVKYMRQRNDPIMFPLSAGNLVELLVNIDAAYVLV